MKCIVIAEIGWNFMGDMQLAEEMIQEAKKSGADYAKFQYWNPEKLKSGPWDTDGRREIYEAAKLDGKKISLLKNFCKDNDIEFLISAFNKSDAQYISELGIEQLKIPSHEVANKSLHEYSAKNFKKVFVSLGAGRPSEIELASSIYNAQSNLWWVGMHCVSSYPCPDESANLPRINYIAKSAKIVGFSDHTTSILTPSISLAYGVRVIEKHFTVDKKLPGRDNKFALDPDEFRSMVTNIRVAESTLIDHGIDAMPSEKDTMENYRGRWGN
tara:strand:+ start:1038 stop:1850 length:813 start_codon:yes stop_codon:yes gene_type:complete